MLILHAAGDDGGLLIWGETPASPSSVPGRRRRSKAKAAATAVSPYDADAKTLRTALAEALTDPAGAAKAVETATAWLPSLHEAPIPSSPLLVDVPPDPTGATLAPWSVTAVRLTPPQAVELLCACGGRETLAPGIVIGKDLAFWATALRLAGALVARQQFLPAVQVGDDGAQARWEPALTGAEATRFATLAGAMPSACRALSRSADAAPAVAASTLLMQFLANVTDHLIRSAQAAPVALVSARRRSRARPTPTFDSVHDQWLHALRATDGTLTGKPAELRQLAEQVQEWRRPISVATAAPFRLCFRLEEPDIDDDDIGTYQSAQEPWYVRYLLQATDDPSLLVPVADAWNGKGRHTAVLRRGGFQAHEYLLAALGRAAGIESRIESSLKTATPGGYELDAAAAQEFLQEKAWQLEQAGFGVFLPAWWTRKGTKLRLGARAHVKSPTMQGGSGLSLEELVQFDWEVALGEQTISRKELEVLAQLKSPLLKVRGQWVQLSAEEIHTALDFWTKHATSKATLRDVVRMALGGGEAPGGLAFEGVHATGWIADFLAQLEGRANFEELPAPARFQGTLRPYQVRGYSWLGFLRRCGLGACLADDMGLGKTIQALALVQGDWEANGRRPTLLICPMSVVGNWQKEAARFTPELPVLVHHGLGRVKGPAFQKEARKHALVLSSYALLHRDFEVLKGVGWAGVILDEAQNIKNPQTKQAQAARALPADYRVALTGTPVENHVGDLWSVMEFLNPGFLGTQTAFKRNFFVPIQASHDAAATEQLKRLTGPFILRRLKTDKNIIADLPDKLEMKVFCTLTKEQASLYAAVVQEAARSLDETEGIQRKGVVLATLSKLKQVCNHPAQFLGDNSAIPGRSGKLARLTEMLEEVLATGERALIFTQFAEMGAILRRHLQETFGREVLFLHGGTTKKQRDDMVARFQAADGPAPFFVLSLKAGGTGLNLTAANHVFHFDRWWNPAVENQATDRAFRIGQTRNVLVHKFLCAGTLEDKIDEMIERKQAVASRIVGSGEAWLTELSTAELKELFALRAEALGE